MNIKELRERLAALYAEGAQLRAKSQAGTLTEDEDTRYTQLADEAADLGTKLKDAEARQSRDTSFERGHETYNQPNGRRVSGLTPTTPEASPEERERESRGWDTIGDQFVHSDNLAQYRQNVGRGGTSKPLDVGSFYARHNQRRRADASEREERALITSTVVADAVLPTRIPGVVLEDVRPLRVRDVMLNQQTDSNLIEFVRMASITNNAAEVAEATSLTTGLKPESGFALEPDSAPVRTIAHIEYATRQALDDMSQLRGIIEDQLTRGIEEREDRQLVIGDGVAPNLRGIYNTPNAQNLNGAYWAANPLPTDGAAPNKWDRLLRAITKIRVTGRSRASAILLNPNQVEEFLMFKTSTGAYAFGGGPAGGLDVATMWRLPVVEQEDIPVNEAVVGAFNRHSIVYDRMQSQVYATDSNRDLFERNIITFLAESRLALVVTRPVAFAKVDLVATI